MYIPVWAAICTGLFLVIAAVVGGYFGFRGINRTAQSTDQNTLIHGLTDFTTSLQSHTRAYEDLLKKFADVTTTGAASAAKAEMLEGKLASVEQTMGAKIARLQTTVDELTAQLHREREQSVLVPELREQLAAKFVEAFSKDEQLAKKDILIARKDAEMTTLNALLSVAARGQGMAEGALVERDAAQKPGV